MNTAHGVLQGHDSGLILSTKFCKLPLATGGGHCVARLLIQGAAQLRCDKYPKPEGGGTTQVE